MKRIALLAILVCIVSLGCADDGGSEEGASAAPSREQCLEKGPDYTWDADTQDCLAVAEEILDEIETESVPLASNAATTPESDLQSNDEYKVLADYLGEVVTSADRMWAKYFLENGLREPAFAWHVIRPGQSLASECTNLPTFTADTNNASYCPVDEMTDADGRVYDGTVYLPGNTMLKMWSNDIFGRKAEVYGDFTAAIITVHEIGHDIVFEFMNQLPANPPVGKYRELVPDCFAGVWLAHKYQEGTLTEKSFKEAVAALYAIGDYLVDSPDFHGTPLERREAVLLGYAGSEETGHPPGSPAACIDELWLADSQ